MIPRLTMSTAVTVFTRTGDGGIEKLVKSMRLPETITTSETSLNTAISFITSNARKLGEVRKILGPDFPVELQSLPLDLDEIQDEDPDVIAARKCCEAVHKVGAEHRLIIEDTSLVFHALNGLPGPYVKWFEKKIGNNGMVRLLSGFEDKSATATATVTFWDGKQVILFKGQVDGRIIESRGPTDSFGWDPIFVPRGFDQTFAEMGSDEKNKISHRVKAINLFKDYVTGVISVE